MPVSEVNDTNFDEEVLKSDAPVLVDFWAPYCGPCRVLMPVVQELADENEGSAKVVKVNIQESPETAKKYSVHGIPMLVIYKDGKPVKQMSGIQKKQKLQEALDEFK